MSSSDSRTEKLLLFFPSFEAVLESLTVDGENLLIETVCEDSSYVLNVLADGPGVKRRLRKEAEHMNEFKIPFNTDSLRVYLVDSSDDIVDFHEETRSWLNGAQRVLYAGAAYPQELVELIRRGETDRVEFKEFIRSEDKRKSQDIIKTVIAFANVAGGTIIMGVNDEAEIIGVDHERPNDPRKGSSFLTDYSVWLRKFIAGNLNRVPPLEIQATLVGEKTVLVLKVGEGSEKPYVNFRTRETYIRRGANNIRPDPDTELRPLLERQTFPLGNPDLDQ
jgi:hypothetical protein